MYPIIQYIKHISLSLALSCLATLQTQAETTPRYIALGTAVGEMLYAFGEGDAVIARDSSCQIPAEILDRPAIGYFRAVPVEGVLSMAPSAIFTTDAAGPPNALAQLKASGIPVHKFSSQPTMEALRSNIAKMGKVLDKPDRATELLAGLDADLAAIPTITKDETAQVLFLLSPPGSGRLLAAGGNTTANKMIHLAGAENAFADMQGYRPVSAEVIADRAPDYIILPGASADGSSSAMEVQHPAIERLVTSGKSRLIKIDLARKLAFGISTGSAAKALHEEIYR